MVGFDLLQWIVDEEPQILPADYLTNADPVFGHKDHYYKETIVDDLGLAALGVQGDVTCHLPLWETAGTQALDVSMRENHSDFVNGPTLGADPPPRAGAVHAVEFDGDTSNGGIHLGTLGDHFSGGDFTVGCWVYHRSQVDGDRDQVWSKGSDSTARVHLRIIGDEVRFEIEDRVNGTGDENVQGSFVDQTWTKVVCRHDGTAAEMAMFVDGTQVGTADTSALTIADTSADDFYFAHNASDWANTTGALHGFLALPIVFDGTALTDAECAAL